MVDWLQSLDWEHPEIFAEKLPFSLSMLSDDVAVPSKDFKTIPAKLGQSTQFLPSNPKFFLKMSIREVKSIGK